FKPLTLENYQKIAALMLDEMKEPLSEKGISLAYDDAALAKIAEKSFGGKFGARDIRKVIRKEVEDKVASLIIDKAEAGISTVKVTVLDDKLEVLAI
ncbi:MAG TPA: ATP-dependent Clp protease ATP-binding subunit, partial [Oscillospiraceae bacterium]|nr:ATP-dependent Clp protease ATP-binding subunit [Oscillospiraceae bacterium]